MSACGLVALGDSITYGEGGIVLGVDGRSWALWLAMALDVPYTNYAAPAAQAADVVRAQLPRVRAGHELACVYVGVNDVRSPGWDAEAYRCDLGIVLAGLAACSERLLVCTAPLDLGRPPVGAKVAGLNAIVRAAGSEHGAVVVSLEDLRGWRHVLPDAVHPTALGQLEIADRAALAVGAVVLPSALVSVDGSLVGRARFARGYALDVARYRLRRVTERVG